MRISHWIGAGVAAAVVGTTAAFVAPALAAPAAPTVVATASAAPADTERAALCPGPKAKALWAAAPEQLKADLGSALVLGRGDARRDALRTIRKAELSGTYGSDVQTFAENRQAAWVAAYKALPDSLKTELKKVRAMSPGDERRDAAKALFDKALAGSYGPAAQTRAQHLQECRAQR